jgi:hypothetical protein
MMTPTRALAESLAFLQSAYPRQKWPAATVETYRAILSDLPPEVVAAVVLDWCSGDHEWPPTAGQLRQLAFDLLDRQAGVPSADEAFAEVARAIRQIGRGAAPRWSHPHIGAAVAAIGGWMLLCESDNFTADRARFLDGYERIAGQRRHDERMLPQVRAAIAHGLLDGGAPLQITTGGGQ